MFIVGIDPSLSSSAIAIYDNGEISVYNYTSGKKSNKWIKGTMDIISYSFHDYIMSKDFSGSEVDKLRIYDEVTSNIVETIKLAMNGQEATVYIEGYSYGSKGKIIDLVSFSTLIRHKLISTSGIDLVVVPPASLKQYIGSVTAKPDKKGIYRNDEGKAAGSFDKKDMMKALLSLDISSPYLSYVRENRDTILSTKNIPKPFDDVNDSLILMYYGIMKE